MSVSFRISVVSLFALGLAHSAIAQDPVRNTKFVLGKFDTLRSDTDFLVNKLANEPAGAKKLDEFLDLLADGADETKPVRVDVIVEKLGHRLVTFIPVSQAGKRGAGLSTFLDNLEAFGIMNRRKARTRWELRGAFLGHMRYVHLYAAIAEQLADIPSNLPNPTDDIQAISGHGFAFQIQNDPEALGVENRQKLWASLQKEILAGVKSKDKESKEAFALRKKTTEHQLNEAARYFAESAEILITWNLDRENKKGNLDLSLSAIPETDLAKTVEEFGKSESYFARIPRQDNSILSLRANHPLDELRKSQLLEGVELMKALAIAEIDSSEDVADKVGAKKIAELILGMVADGGKLGVVDGFAEVVPQDSGKYTLTAGLRTPDGTATVEVLKTLAEVAKGIKVELDVEEAAGVKFHKVHIPEDDKSDFEGFYGSRELLIGTSTAALWFAAGEGAADALKAAIAAVSGEGEAVLAKEIVLDAIIKVRPWLQRRINAAGEPAEDEAEERKVVRESAVDAIKDGVDVITIQMKKEDGKVVGRTQFDSGLLTFVGKVSAYFAEKYLAE